MHAPPLPRPASAIPLPAFAALVGLLVACSSDDPDPVASGTIDPATGGSVAVASGTLAGTAITVAPGSLSATVTISIYDDGPSKQPGVEPIGPAARFEPSGTQFNPVATASLPFDDLADLSSIPPSAFVVGRRDATGQVSLSAPTSVDTDARIATFDVAQFSTYWVALEGAVFPSQYFPLNDGDDYRYDNGNTIIVELSSSVPNIGGSVAVVRLRSAFTTSTQYLRFDDEGIVSDGRAFSFQGRQEVYDENLLWLPDVALVGSSKGDSATFVGYDTANPTNPAYTGTIDTTVTIVAHGPLTTPLDTFEDVIEVHTISVSTNSRQETRTDESTIWYARNFGPVQIRRDDGPTGAVVAATVGGVPR